MSEITKYKAIEDEIVKLQREHNQLETKLQRVWEQMIEKSSQLNEAFDNVCKHLGFDAAVDATGYMPPKYGPRFLRDNRNSQIVG